MNSVEIMVMEHEYILRMLKVVRKASFKVMKGEEINYEDFNKMIEFIRQYADAHHHGKEEKFLFKEMQTKLGKLGENLITHGMLVEHDFGRLYMSDLTDALQRVKDGDEAHWKCLQTTTTMPVAHHSSTTPKQHQHQEESVADNREQSINFLRQRRMQTQALGVNQHLLNQ